MKTEKGFAVILLISILPLVLAGGLALLSVFSFLKSDLATLNVCRAKQMEVQNKVGKILERLLKTNPQALKLRLAHIRAKKALAVALESGAPPAIAAAEAYLLSVTLRRQTLDFKQKTLIATANASLDLGGLRLQGELLSEWNKHSTPVNSWLWGSLQLMRPEVPTLAVRADLPEVAPLYELLPAFADAQAWKQAWKINIKTTSWARKYFIFNGRFERSCTTSLYPENVHWIARLKKDKSLLKGFF